MSKRTTLFLVLLMILGGVFFFLGSAKSSSELVSPMTGSGRQAVNLWFPEAQAQNSDQSAPEVSAKAAYFVETKSGQVLYQKQSHERLPIASLTKIMTVIVTLEHKDYQDSLVVSSTAANMEPDHMMLIAGERLTVEELLDGIFLVSANDASEVFAEKVLGNRDQFITLMNQKAISLGMKDSLFINPSGLEEDERTQYSTAYDVALMSRYAIKTFPHLLDISRQEHIYLPITNTHQDYDMYSGINLLTTYPGVVGFKTGFTPEAGLTLVTIANRGDKQVLGVLLGSENRREDAKQLLDYSFKKLNL